MLPQIFIGIAAYLIEYSLAYALFLLAETGQNMFGKFSLGLYPIFNNRLRLL